MPSFNTFRKFQSTCAGAMIGLALLLAVAVVMNCSARLSSGLPPAASRPHPAPAFPAQLKSGFHQLSLGFEANRGQAGAAVKFIARGDGYSLSLKATEAIFRFQGGAREARGERRGSLRRAPASIRHPQTSVLRMKLLGARARPLIFGRDEQPGRSHYFTGGGRRLTDVPRYASVEYQEVYPGVNLVFHGRRRQLEYDFVVAPGANPRAIRLGFAGAEGMEINARGDLALRVAGGEVVQHAPVVYQETERGQQMVEGRYIRAGRDEIAFEIGDYDRSRPLVIDPVLSFATYLGGGSESGNAIAVDAAGNVYVTGTTSSPGFPARNGAGAFLNGGDDVFVAKLNAAGALVYATYLGGSGTDAGFGIAVDADGAAYVTGSTASNDYPTANAFQNTLRGRPNAFLTKLNAAGNALVYSTYLGGSGFDEALAVAVDAAGAAYVAGDADSPDFPTTQGALKTRLSGFAVNAFVTKFNATGATLAYSTLLGGSEFDLGLGVAVDGQGNAHVTGDAASGDFPTTPGAIQARSGGEADSFAAKLNATGSALVYSTYLGGNGRDFGRGVALDAAGNAYVVGETNSTNFPTTPGAFQRGYGGGAFDGFGAKFGPSGALLFATYFGGSGNDQGFAAGTDGAGNLYATGVTDSTNLMTVNPSQSAISGGGVFKSTNGASNWNASSVGPFSATVSSIAIDPVTPTTLYAGTNGGVFKSTDGGANWSASHSGLPNSSILSLAIDPVTPTTLYTSPFARGVFKSTNGGGSWSASNTGIQDGISIRALVINPTTPATLYAASAFLVSRSTNGGGSWTQTANFSSIISTLAIDPATPATLYAGTATRGVFKTIDAGSGWSAIDTGLTNLNIRALAIDPAAPATVYAGTAGGVFKSTNGGNTWIAANTGLANLNVRALAIAPANPSTIYAGTNGGVFKSVDGGANWSAANTGMASPQTLALAVDPRAPATLYAGTNGNDAFIVKIGASGSLLFSTYFGGSGGDSGFGVAADGAGAIHVTGSTSSANLPITPNAIQNAAGGSVAFIARISDAFTCSLACAAAGPGSGTAGLPAAFTAGATPSGCAGATGYVWDFGDGAPRVFQQNPSHVYLAPGTYTWTFAATNVGAPACSQTGTITITGRGVANVSAASFLGDEIARDSIVSALGSNLATATQAAAATPLPTSLAGTTVRIRDSAGVERFASLFFVSPGQINYLFPPEAAPGLATMTATSGDGTVSLGAMRVAEVAPGLFAANASGQGVAAGVAVRVRAGAQTTEPIARFDAAQNRFVSVPIDLGPATDQVFLVLFGTGIRNRSALSTVNARIGGVESQVAFAGAQGALFGLDQVNLLIPRSLIGKGEVNVALAVEGRAVNLVRANLR